MYTNQQDHQIQEAVSFLSSSINASGNNPKPVVVHCIRVAMSLYGEGKETDVIVAALLHDLVEDSSTQIEMISEKFGSKIATIVLALTMNRDIGDKKEQFMDSLERLRQAGKEALLIRCADLLDNSNYYSFAPDDLYKWLIEKNQIFLRETESELKGEKIYDELSNKIRVLVENNL